MTLQMLLTIAKLHASLCVDQILTGRVAVEQGGRGEERGVGGGGWMAIR